MDARLLHFQILKLLSGRIDSLVHHPEHPDELVFNSVVDDQNRSDILPGILNNDEPPLTGRHRGAV
jgi:hypothetical protein